MPYLVQHEHISLLIQAWLTQRLYRLLITPSGLSKKAGLEKLVNLRVVYCSNNKLKDWAEVDRLKVLPALEELLLAGNPLHIEYKDRQALPDYRLEVIIGCPFLGCHVVIAI